MPIDVVPGRSPPIFRWRQTVDTPIGKKVVEHEGALPPTAECAVATLIGIAKQLILHNQMLTGTLDMAVDRLGGQVEGRPTHSGNFLQRIDELVADEATEKSERSEGANAQATRVAASKRAK